MLNQHKKAAIIIAMTAATSLAGLAHAQIAASTDPAPQAAAQATHTSHGNAHIRNGGRSEDWLNIGQVYSQLEGAGYTDIREIEREHDGYEVKARNKNGKFVELYVDPVEGRVVREKVRNRD